MTRFALLLALLAGGLVASPALADKVSDSHGEMQVVDDAGLFTSEAIAKAKASFSETSFHGHVRFAVHTVKEIPASKRAEFESIAKDANARGRFFKTWADELARSDAGDPIVALIYWDGKRYITKVVSDEATSKDKGRRFSDSKAAEVDRAFNNALDAVLKEHLAGEAMHARLDSALTDATHLVINDLKNTMPVAANHERAATHSEAAPQSEKGSGIMGYVCIGIAVLLGLWLVFGLIRAFTGGGGGGGVMGGGGGMGGGGYGGGGGGGGFMSGMLGGMFGGLAGSWMYNHFLGGGSGMSGFGGSDNTNVGGGGDNNIDTGEGNYDNGASAGGEGGDWGSGDAGGGDAGGGGDWGGGGDGGGGGDAGGGGDW